MANCVTLLFLAALVSVVVAHPPWRSHHAHEWGRNHFPGYFGYHGQPEIIVIVKEKTPAPVTSTTAAPATTISTAGTTVGTTLGTAAPGTTG
ncbi:hypothetical protein L798_08447 [Zootermopsis nevadensis]|uniref:Uncharacterized protein n=1 Tax=Zootermopsis nevadensis TaxID=136037 RepID=A0A067RES1_ZOONE|nr:hypothetical protein L798_08447 [Zootermopsis nevadensis]